MTTASHQTRASATNRSGTNRNDERALRRDPERLLRATLAVNAGSSVVTGLIGAIAAGPVSDLLGVQQAWLVRLIGVGLIAFAIGAYLLSRATRPVLAARASLVTTVDFSWVVGTVAVIAGGWLSTIGAILMAAIGVVVLGYGLTQFMTRRAL